MLVQSFGANRHFYPRSPCGERPRTGLTCGDGKTISIHALLAESDNVKVRMVCISTNFYPRSPCGERQRRTCQRDGKRAFLSTLSLRRATERNHLFSRWICDFYPRSPCGERRGFHKINCQLMVISIHALLAESDYALR